ncbi:UNVERIFIED_ORG: hypothetical protein ABIB19_003189 [Arthrobacter sp. UYEF10]
MQQRHIINAVSAGDHARDHGEGFIFVDVDDTIVEVHGYQKQGSGYGYSGVRGLKRPDRHRFHRRHRTGDRRPTAAQGRDELGPRRQTLRHRRAGHPQTHRGSGKVLCRFDSAYYGHAAVAAALAGDADVSVTVRMDPAVKRAIAAIPESAWEAIEYTNALFDEDSETWISAAEVAEIQFSAFSSRKTSERITGRLVVRRILELNPKATQDQPTLFDTHRFHAFFTTVPAATLGSVAADKTHRKHARIEQVNADLKNSALAHLPSGNFAANSAWLVASVMAYNLTRTAGILAAGPFAKARTGTIRRKLINVPARIASSARRVRLRMPESPTANSVDPTIQPVRRNQEPKRGTPTAARSGDDSCPKTQTRQNSGFSTTRTRSVDQG